MAVRIGEDPDRWGLVGLLHDFDYERWPNAAHSPTDEHPAAGVRVLREAGYPDDVLDASFPQGPKTRPVPRPLLEGIDRQVADVPF